MAWRAVAVAATQHPIIGGVAADAVVHRSLALLTAWVALLTEAHRILEESRRAFALPVGQYPVEARLAREAGITLGAS